VEVLGGNVKKIYGLRKYGDLGLVDKKNIDKYKKSYLRQEEEKVETVGRFKRWSSQIEPEHNC